MGKRIIRSVWAIAAAALLLAPPATAFAQRRLPLDRQGRGGRNIGVLGPQFPRRNQRIPGEPTRNPRVARREDRRLGINAERKRKNQLMLEAIGLSPEQRNRMTGILRSHEDQAVATGRRVREARQALDRAIMSEQYDEAIIRQRIDEMAAAVAEKARLQARMRAEARSVLTRDQVVRLKQLQRQQRLQQQDSDRQQEEKASPPARPPDGLEELDLLSLLLLQNR
jgi:Spy/CpxP family protein refolding chaperone